MARLLAMAFALAALLGLTTLAHADHWSEVGDAGGLPATAQVTRGKDPLTAIRGTIASETDADMYEIFVSAPATFSATTVAAPGTLPDPQLFLFDAAGMGVMANDDSAGGFGATLPAGHPSGPSMPGSYYLAVFGFDHDPVSPEGLIFPSLPFSEVYGPTGPGGGSPLTGWTGVGNTGTYTIFLTGAEFRATSNPEPASFVLLGLGALGLVLGLRWRRTRPAA